MENGTIIVEGNLTCDHLGSHHPAQQIKVEVQAEFSGVDSHKHLKVGDRGICVSQGCDHSCRDVEVTYNKSLFFNINPLTPKMDRTECSVSRAI